MKGFKEVIEVYNVKCDSGKIVIVVELLSDVDKEKGFKVTEDAI